MLPKEKHLEESIENHLVSIGYEQGHSQEFDLENCLFVEDLFRFLVNLDNKKMVNKSTKIIVSKIILDKNLP